jgi:hypothetical protein
MQNLGKSDNLVYVSDFPSLFGDKGDREMAKGDYYFGKSVIPNMGRMFYLRFPIAIDTDNPADNLLGSLVREGAVFLGDTYPLPEHSHIPGSVLDAMAKLGRYTADQMVQDETLATPVVSVDINKSIGVNGKAPIPGVPVGAGFEINYKKVKSIDIDFGGSAKKRYLSYDVMEECYAAMASNAADYPPAFFKTDRMIVDRIVIVRDLSITITSKVQFDAGLTAQLQNAANVGGGVKYSNVTDRSFTLKLDGAKPYLFGVGAVQADKWVKER